MNLKIKYIRLNILAVLVMALLTFGSLTVLAHDFGNNAFLYDTSVDYDVETRDGLSGGEFGQICDATDDILDNTEFDPNSCSYYSYAGNVIHYKGDYGVEQSIGMAFMHTNGGSVDCQYSSGFFNGNCDENTDKADHAYIYWNSNGVAWDADLIESVARHEMLHVLGISHAPCNGSTGDPVAVMNPLPCNNSDTLETHDISDVNGEY